MKFYKFLSNILKFALNIIFLTQILLMVLVFFTASYWFFSLAGSKLFGFVEPMAESISEFIKLF